MRKLLPVLVLLGLLAGFGVYLSRPVTCPGCEGRWRTFTGHGLRPVNPGCPRCEDEGEVTRFWGLLARPPHPDLRAMLRSFSEGDQAGEEFEPALRRLIERSGLNIDVGEAPDGRIVYLHDGVDVLLGIDVGIRQEGARDRVVALLCDEDGVMLDVATVSWPRVSSPVFIGHHWSHGDREPRALHFSRSGISNPTEPTFLLERGRELTRVTDSRWALQARRGRWEVRPPEAKP